MKWIDRHWFTRRRILILAGILVGILALLYWEEHGPPSGPSVVVTRVQQQTVPVKLDYVGETAAVRTVDIRARVEGFLIERTFEEGDDVPEGELLYVIDPRPFEAALMEARGQLAKDRAALAYAEEQVERYRDLVDKDYVSREEFDGLVTQADEARAAVEADEGAVEQAELNLSYCRMVAPFDGRIGRTLVHVGNLVGAGESTKLATINQLDPIYVYFSPSDEDAQKIMAKRNGKPIPVELTLANGTVYAQSGTVDFVDNTVDLKTSTVAMRALLPNPDHTLLPGMYVDTKIVVGQMHDALLVPEKAIGEDQGGQFVMIVDPDDEVRKSYVTIAFAHDGMQVISKGVEANERVIVQGLQLVKPGTIVHAEEQDPQKGTVRDVVHSAVGLNNG